MTHVRRARWTCALVTILFAFGSLAFASKPKMAHLYDISGSRLAQEFGFPKAQAEHATVQVWVASRPPNPEAARLVTRAVDAALALDAELSTTRVTPRIDVYVEPVQLGEYLIATVSDPNRYAGAGLVRVFRARVDGAIEGPIVKLATGWGSDGVNVPHRRGEVLSLVVTYRDSLGGWNVKVSFPDGREPRRAVSFQLLEIAKITSQQKASVIMLVTDWQNGIAVYRIIEVTDHIEDLVVPVRMKSFSDPRRAPNLTEAELREVRQAASAIELKFQQIVLSRGARPPHMPVHVGDLEAEGSRPHPVPRSTAVPK